MNKQKTIGIIALSGVCEEQKVLSAKSNLEQIGFNVKLADNIFDKKRYLAGSDEIKIKTLYDFFEDPSIDIILNARGGYGSIRLINKIDYNIIKNNPKPFIGFSDITALLLMFYKKAGIITFHGPMACSDFTKINNSVYKILEKAINNETLEFYGSKIYREGSANGIMWGGNLATVVSLCGQDFLPDKDFLFFAEDLNESVYKIDKMFNQLLNINEFQTNCKALILGDFLDSGNEIWLEEFFQEVAEELKIPIVGGFKITHNKEKITIPIGKKGIINGNILKI